MKQRAILVTGFALLVGASFVLTGCSRPDAEEEAAGPPSVVVSRPIERNVTDYHDFTGRTAAVESVQVRARVWGYLRKINFREGALVQKNSILFEIDPRTYLAELDRTQANVAQSRAHRDRLQADAARARTLYSQRGISREEFDKIVADAAEAEAAVRVTEASVATAQLNVDDTKVRAPVSGRVSRTRVTVGNMVQSGENGGTMLTTLVSIDPVYAYFDVDDLTYLNIRHLTLTDSENPAERAAQPVLLGLPNEPGYPHTGKIDFVDNQVEPGTGTMKMRGIFPNPSGLLTPGLFVRVRVPLGEPHRALLVTDRAIDSDQGRKVIYVLHSDDTIEKRPVRLGKLHDGLRAIESGIAAGERVVIDGIHRVRPGLAVEPHLIAMPEANRTVRP